MRRQVVFLPTRSGRHLLIVCLACISAQTAWAQPTELSPPYDRLWQLVDGNKKQRREIASQLAEQGDHSVVPGLVDALFFVPQRDRGPLFKALRTLSGEDAGRRYLPWIELVGRRQDLTPAPGYLAWKRHLLSRIDRRYASVLYPGAPARIRLEEVVSGGVAFEGIPALDDPPFVAAEEADQLRENERVFGISINDRARAYPLRYLSWHELANDVVGGTPVVLSYCTLCGSGIAYKATTPNGTRRTFGTSGLLYRSNKLMVDRSTLTLWSNFTGEPVVGRLARSPVALEMLPMTLTTWGEWRREHPQTTVVQLDTAYGSRWGYRYQPGLSDRAREGVAFPVWQKSAALEREEEIYGLRWGESAKAYPLRDLYRRRLVHDRLGDMGVLLVADATSGAVRAFHAGGRRFRRVPRSDQLLDENGVRWRVTEHGLQPPAESGLNPLARIPGHHAFWFGWYAFLPHTEVYQAAD